MSGLTGLVDTLVADKLSLRPDLVRLLQSAAKVTAPDAAVPVDPVGKDVRLSNAASDRPLLSGSESSLGLAQPGPAQELSAAARVISALLKSLPEAAGPVTGTSALAQPGTAPATLAHSLAAAVSGSGLFYDSHVAEFAAGRLARADLDRQPQAAWTRMAGGRDLATGPMAIHDRPSAPTASELSQISGRDSSGPDSPALIHPQARTLVAQQLELLATGVFSWRGEAWPGVAMAWSIQQEREQPPGQSSDGGADAVPAWSTRLVLSMPELGSVTLRLSLAGDRLRACLCASDSASALLRESAGALRRRLAGQGIELAELALADAAA